MSQNLHKIFKSVTELDPAENLCGRILAMVEVEENRIIKRKMIISRFGLGLSAMAFLTAVFPFGQIIAQSEFWNIVSLIFSDMQVVAQNWQDFSYSLLETFPTVSMVVVLAPAMMLMFSFSAYLEANNKHKYI